MASSAATPPGHDVERVLAALPARDPIKLAVGVASLGGGQAMIWLTDRVDVFAGFGMLVSALGIAFLWTWWRERDPHRAPIMRALLEAPARIVWVYHRSVWRRSEQVGEVHVHFDDGACTVLQLPAASECSALVDVFRR